jgi:hypothetical protein
MKKIFLSILTSALCFTGISPVFAGTTPVQVGSQTSSIPTLRYIPPNSANNLLSIDISKAIAVLVSASANNANISNIVVLLSNDNGSGTGVANAQSALSRKLASLGINVDVGSPASSLIEALTGLIPAGFSAGSGQNQTINLSKLSLAIDSFNQIVNGLADTAKGSDTVAAGKALVILNALSSDETLTSLSTSLSSIAEEVEKKLKKP